MRNKKSISPDKVNEIKGLLTNCESLRDVARIACVSVYTVYRVKVGCYDTGKLVYKFEKATEKGMFNPSERENWLI